MDDDATPELRKTPTGRACITAEANAIVCYLRLHPSVAKTYGIIKVDGNTSVGSMLMQTLWSQGAGVDWHERLPDGAHGKDKNANQKWSAYIKRIYTRPGGRKKRLDERPEVAPPDNSAMLRHHGRLPKVSFPMLVRLAKYRRPKKTSGCEVRIRLRRPRLHHCSLTTWGGMEPTPRGSPQSSGRHRQRLQTHRRPRSPTRRRCRQLSSGLSLQP